MLGMLSPKRNTPRVPKVNLPGTVKEEGPNIIESGREDDVIKHGIRAPVGVTKPRGVVNTAPASDRPGGTATVDAMKFNDQPLTPRLVQGRKGGILEIFGSEKSIDVEKQSMPKKGWLSIYQKLMWNKKYFVIMEGFLLYFSKEKFDLTRPDGILHLANCDVVDCGTSKRFSFAINCPNGDGLTLLGETPNDVWEWMSAIYLASKVSTRACLSAEIAKETMEENSRRLQMIAQQLVRTMDMELKSIHSQVRLLKADTQQSLETLKTENDERFAELGKTIGDLDRQAQKISAEHASTTEQVVRNPAVDQVVVIAMKSLQSQMNTMREGCKLLKDQTRVDLRNIKEEYEAQVMDLATRYTTVTSLTSTQRTARGILTDRYDDDETSQNRSSSLARAVIELRELAEILQPHAKEEKNVKVTRVKGKEKDIDSQLSAAVRKKLVEVVKDLPSLSDMVKQVEEERRASQREKESLTSEIEQLSEELRMARLNNSTLAAEGQQVYEMLTNVEDQLYTAQTKDGSVFDNQDPTHVKVYKVMKAFERSMTLVAEVEEQLFTLTTRSKQTFTTRRFDDDD